MHLLPQVLDECTCLLSSGSWRTGKHRQEAHLLLQALHGRKHLWQAVKPCSLQGCRLLGKVLDSQCCLLLLCCQCSPQHLCFLHGREAEHYKGFVCIWAP